MAGSTARPAFSPHPFGLQAPRFRPPPPSFRLAPTSLVYFNYNALMANTTFNIPRNHLAMALCLPLAVLLGYVLAEPLESGSIAVVVFVLVVLSVPILMKWHHPLLILSWNAAINPVFLPGRAALWLLLA